MTVPPEVREPGGNLAVLRLGQATDDEQADADAAEPAAVARLALEEPVEDALVIAVGDADALVFHRDLDPGPPPGPTFTRARTLTVPPAGEYLKAFSSSCPTMMSVAMVSPLAAGQVGGDVRHHDMLVRQRPERGGGPVQHGGEVERAVADRQLIGAGPRAEQQLLDQPAERPGPLRDGPHRGPPFGVGELVPPAGQRAGESLHHGDGRAQLVAGGGQEQVLRLLKLLGRGDVPEVDRPAPRCRRRARCTGRRASARSAACGSASSPDQAAGTTAACRWRPGPASR